MSPAPCQFSCQATSEEFKIRRVTETDILKALQHLSRGFCVAIPTETVYGLAAKFDSPEGVASIFRLKERPSFDPLIVHVADLEQVKLLAAKWPLTARKLAEKFWPGPLTLVVPKRPEVNSMISAGLETVGIRMPRHSVALDLIRRSGPLAAPSANRFGRTSPTRATHVLTEFPAAIADGEILVLDGGDAEIGVESTVCFVAENAVTVLRPGGVTLEEIQEAFKNDPALSSIPVTRATATQASPGHTEHHYETTKPLIVSWAEPLTDAVYEVNGRKIAREKIESVPLPSEPALAARALYGLLRDGDRSSTSEALFIQRDLRKEKNRGGLWSAIDDRLTRASRLQLGSRSALDV